MNSKYEGKQSYSQIQYMYVHIECSAVLDVFVYTLNCTIEFTISNFFMRALFLPVTALLYKLP